MMTIKYLKANILLFVLLLMSIQVNAIPWSNYVTEQELSGLTDSQKKGLEIAIQEDLQDIGWQDSRSNMVMTVRNKSGSENIREITLTSLEVPGDGDKSLSVVRTPKDLQGTAFLSYSHIEGPDDQWVYLTSIKRVKRINSNNKSGPYMGSEFSYEDLSSFEVKKYDFNYLRDEQYEGRDYYVVERFPRDPNSGYTRIISWIDKERFTRVKVEFYDRKKSLLKTLTRSNYELFLGKYWRALTLNMQNHQTGKSTMLEFNDLEFNTGLESKDFDKNSLKRAR